MDTFEYSWIELNDGDYLDPMMEHLGEILDICVSNMSMTGQETMEAFVDSGLAREFERQNPVFVLGKSGVELVEYMFLQSGRLLGEDGIQHVEYAEQSVRDHWIGMMLAYFQATKGYSYRQIAEALPYPRLEELAVVYMPEATPDTFAAILAERISEAPWKSNLKAARLVMGLSQAELANTAHVSLRALQQYEQGAKNINHASAAALYRLSLVLNCTIEQLLEPPVL